MIYKRENREYLKKYQKAVKNYLRGRWFWKSKYVMTFDELLKMKEGISNNKEANNQGTFFNKTAKPKTSFTENLRNERGYANHLKLKYK